MKRKFLTAICLVAFAVMANAQQQLNNESIIKMHDAGMGNDLIIATINAQSGAYSTTLNDLMALKKAGIDDKVISAMVVKNAAPPPVAMSPTSGVVSPTPSEPIGKPRIFLLSASKGNNQNAARDQSMEMSKDFERDCSAVRITLNQSAADFTVSLNHIEVGLFVRDNQFQIADNNGDLLSKTSEGGSIAGGVKKACAKILSTWQQMHPELAPPAPVPPTPPNATPPANN
jgi:hypothetical protein